MDILTLFISSFLQEKKYPQLAVIKTSAPSTTISYSQIQLSLTCSTRISNSPFTFFPWKYLALQKKWERQTWLKKIFGFHYILFFFCISLLAEEFLSGSQYVFLIPIFFQLSVLQEKPAKPDENHIGKFFQGLWLFHFIVKLKTKCSPNLFQSNSSNKWFLAISHLILNLYSVKGREQHMAGHWKQLLMLSKDLYHHSWNTREAYSLALLLQSCISIQFSLSATDLEKQHLHLQCH